MTATSATARRLAAEVRERAEVLEEFLAAEHAHISRICFDVARALHRGNMLIAYGTGSAATDAAHVAVEFMHPVIVGKRAFPAIAIGNDPSGFSRLGRIARAGDIAVGITHGYLDPEIDRFLEQAARAGLLTIRLAGAPPARAQGPDAFAVDHELIVPSSDPFIVQEVQETTYHVLWELVHVFFEHSGLLAEACITCGDVAVPARVVALTGDSATIEKDGARERIAVDLVEDVAIGDVLLCHAGVALQKLSDGQAESRASDVQPEDTGFLYPFLDSEEEDLDRVLVDVGASTRQKGADVSALRAAIDIDAVERCASMIRARLERGGRLLAFGNGGSSTDAQDLAADFLFAGWPSIALTDDVATVTAVANDVGFDNVFARQLIPLARPEDVAVAISTSGSSANVIIGLQEAHRRQLLTCAITGYDGGRLAELDWLDHLLIVRSDYIPRLQEAHATIYHLILDAIGER